MKILVTHAGTSGQAAGMAERVARVLTGLGADVTVRPMSGCGNGKGFFSCCCREPGAWRMLGAGGH
ncbi:MAG: hypothetical protein IPI74_01430 [Bacteroidales bacterium]|nr:hypothetical protein [Bacteroidales bacterium]